MSFIRIVLVLAASAVVLDLTLMIMSFMKRTSAGRALGVTLAAASVCTISYFASVFMHDQTAYSILHGIYFSCVTTSLIGILRFMMLYTGYDHGSPRITLVWRVLLGVGIADVAIELTNFIHHQALTYIYVDRMVHDYTYSPLFFFNFHLGFCYLLVAVLMTLLIQQLLKVPNGYRRKYMIAMFILLAVVGINFVYLSYPGFEEIDYSLFGYSMAALAFYWLAFHYSYSGMAKVYQGWLYNSLRQGLLLFDYQGHLILHNDAASRMLTSLSLQDGMTMEHFLRDAGLDQKLHAPMGDTSVQFYQPSASMSMPMQCETHGLQDKHGADTGRLFVISPVLQETDLLTGFITWDYFRFLYPTTTRPLIHDGMCLVCDVNGLSLINEEKGHSAGDQAMQLLAEELKTRLPRSSVFVRCRDANLAVMAPHLTEAMAKQVLDDIDAMLAALPPEERFSIQSAVLPLHAGTSGPDSVEHALRIIRIKKLLDRSARHSDLLNSIIQILQECDHDTEAHVQRTQRMCFQLGKRLGLDEDELSHLSLLAILHDIGKVGVPLDILNKPGRLSPAEWNVIKSHVEKGARIADSSADLRDISHLILCHHERWDGNGYPAGLSKESIPLLSRIISVVDSYDAMVYNRSYRRAMSEEKARAELKRCAGTQFDPNIVSAMLQMLDETDDNPRPASQNYEDEAVKSGPLSDFIPTEWSRRDVPDVVSNVYPMAYSRYIMDANGMILSVDDQFTALTGYTAEDVRSLNLSQRDLIPPEDWEQYGQSVINLRSPNGSAYLEHRLVKKDGVTIHVFCLGRDYFESASRRTYTEIFVSNVEESHAVGRLLQMEHNRAMSKLEVWENMYRQDSLTGVLNHEAFRSDAQQLMMRGDKQAVLMMLDLDHFKQYNDTYGHRLGDEFLILCAQNLEDQLREGELCSRMGGDEFAALLLFDKDDSLEVICRRGSDICEKLNLLLSARSHGVSGVSCGAAVCRGGLTTFDRVYEAADQALYRAKQNGRGRFSV